MFGAPFVHKGKALTDRMEARRCAFSFADNPDSSGSGMSKGRLLE
jgi:hypothetical protein